MHGENGSRKPGPNLIWTQAHIAALEKQFPERTDATTTDLLQYQRGQRSVVSYVRGIARTLEDKT